MARYRQSGPIDFDDVQEFFGQTRGSAFNLDSYYRGGGIVPATGPNAGQAAVHNIAIDPNATAVPGMHPTGVNEQFFLYLTGNSVDTTVREPRQSVISGTTVDASVTFTVTDSFTPGSGQARLHQFSETNPNNWNTNIEDTASFIAGTGATSNANYASLQEADILRFTDALDSNNFFELQLQYFRRSGSRISYILNASSIVTGGTLRDFVNEDLIVTGFTVVGENTRVRISIPTGDIDSTFDITDGLNTDTAIRDDLLNSIQNQTREVVVYDPRTFSATGTDTTFLWEPSNRNAPHAVELVPVSDGIVIGFGVMADFSAIRRCNTIRLTRGTDVFDFSFTNAIFTDRLELSSGGDIIFSNNEVTEQYQNLIDNLNEEDELTVRGLFIAPGGLVREEFTFAAATSTMADHGITDGLPIIEFTAVTSIDHTTTVEFMPFNGSLTGSLFSTTEEGQPGPASISINFGVGVNPEMVDIVFGTLDSQGIADAVGDSIRLHGELNETVGTNNIRIDDSRQRMRALPTVNVLSSGTSGLTNADFTVTEVQPGIPTTRTTDYLTIEYSTDDVSATTTGWNFQSSITGPTTTFTTWPSTGDIFLHVGLSDVVLDDLETTLGLTEINQTMQDVTDATLTFHYRFLDLVDATTCIVWLISANHQTHPCLLYTSPSPRDS